MLARFRRSRDALSWMCRREGPPKILMQIRNALERYADYLEKGDEYPESKEVMVYQDTMQEIEALRTAMPEVRAEEKWLTERWESLISEIERDRLSYFDSLYGTRTYFHEIKPYQERVSQVYVFEKFYDQYQKDTRMFRMEDIYLGGLSANREALKTKLSKEEREEYFYNEKLFVSLANVYDSVGEAHQDPYHYLDRRETDESDKLMLISYMNSEKTRFYLNTGFDNTYRERLEKDIFEKMKINLKSQSLFLLTSKHTYWKSNSPGGVFRAPSDQFYSNPQKYLKSEINENVSSTVSGRDTSSEQTSRVEHDTMFDINDLIEYFFNFKDANSFGVCRYLRDYGLDSGCIKNIALSNQEKYILIELEINKKWFVLVQDTETKKFFNHYNLCESHTQSHIVSDDQGNSYLALLPMPNPNGEVELFPLSPDSFIEPKARQEEIPSVLKYMKDHEQSLIDNSKVNPITISLGGVMSPVTFGVMVKLGDSLILMIKLLDGTKKLMKLNPNELYLEDYWTQEGYGLTGITKKFEYFIKYQESGESRFYRRPAGNSKEKLVELKLNKEGEVINDVHFLEGSILVVSKVANSSKENLYRRLV